MKMVHNCCQALAIKVRALVFILFSISFLFFPGLVFSQNDHPIEFGFSALSYDGHLPHFKEITRFELKSGISVNTMNWYLGFNGDNNDLPNLPLKRLAEYKDKDITLMLTLEPWGDTMDWRGRRKDPLLTINNGLLDNYIRKLARQLRDFGRPFRLRFGHEMIQDDHEDTKGWYSWQDKPQEFRKAFIRVHNIFVDENALNVEFVWSPNNRPAKLETLQKYYPGSEYVDWIGIDGYTWSGESFDDIFQYPYRVIVGHPEVFGDKPIMLGEFAAGADKKFPFFNKASWIKDAFEKIPISYPRIKSVYWFNVKKERDWRLDSTKDSWTTFINSMRAWQD